MSRNGQEKLFEGWLTKSPPIKRIWRGRWRRRWFSLQQSRDLPGQYVLMYYADRNCRKVKGSIDLDHCEQVDIGLKLEVKKIKFDYMFDIKTPSRTYYLAAETKHEMNTWVKYICSVCGLKATNDEEEVNILQEIASSRQDNNEVPLNDVISTKSVLQSPPVSPVSTSPYIPISECISGSTPFISLNDIKDYQALLQHNLHNTNSLFTTPNYMNDTYETSPTYLNFMQPINSRSYDIPRLLQPSAAAASGQSVLKNNEEINYQNLEKMNPSPLQSPTDSESVFTDDDWSHNTMIQSDKNNIYTRQSESSADIDVSLSRKFIKLLTEDSTKLPELQQQAVTVAAAAAAPPRPPKHHIASGNNTNTATLNKIIKDRTEHKSNVPENVVVPTPQVGLDEMYDFPRSHEIETNKSVNKRHCYNNAAPVSLDGQIFRYDISPKPGTSGVYHFKYEEENSEEPASPMSHTSSTRGYSNLPSPSLPDIQLMPPPIVNRDLKPKRKLSDSLSISSNPEQASPRLAPSVDRHLKPINLLPPKIKQKSMDSEDENTYDNHLVSNVTNLHRSFDSVLYENDETCDSNNHQKLEYLDLDLDVTTSTQIPTHKPIVHNPARSPEANTVYKEVDFTKTIAFNITRNNLEKERNETVPTLKK